MTTAWPAAPTGTDWRELDHLVSLVDRVVAAEARSGGVHQVRWTPEQSVRVAFDRAGGEVVVVEIVAGTTTRRTLADDDALPGLRVLLDPEAVRHRLRELLGEPVRRCTVTSVSYRPGSRCVVRCRLSDGTPGRELFVKVLARGFDAYVENHQTLAGTADGGPPLVPPLIGRWPDLAAVVTAAVPGRRASAVLADPAVPPAEREALALALGALLARVHGLVPGPRAASLVHTAGDETDELASYLPTAWHADATAAPSMAWALGQLRATAPSADRAVLGHGSYRAGQVLVHGGALSLLDLDGVGMADPARDLGNAMAYADWQHLTTPGTTAGLSAAIRRGYADGGGRVDTARLAWWHSAALVKIAGRRYRSLDTAHWAAVPALLGAATALLTDSPVEADARLRHPQGGPDLTDPVTMTGLLRPLLDAPGMAPVTVTSARALRVAHGRRVVVRYHVTRPTGRGTDVIAKAYADPARAALVHRHLVLLDRLRDPVARIGTPPPIGLLPERGIVLYGAVDGRPLSETAMDGRNEELLDVARRCGSWLKALHTSRLALSRTLDLEHETRDLTRWAEDLASADDLLATPARRLADRLSATATELPVVLTAPIHKDLHLGHVLVDDVGAATVIDLDEARMGDPLLDLAHLSAYADDTTAEGALSVRDALLEAYGPRTGPEPRTRLAFFYACTLLKITRQELAGRLTEELVLRGARRLGRGLSCLPG